MSIKKISLPNLIKIRDRDYRGVFGREYEKAEIDREIERKITSKGYRGFYKVRKD